MEEYLEQQTISPLLFSFISEFKFNSRNLDSTNHYGTTPITLAIEKNQQDILLELLRLKANPLIENIHGNTALSLSKDKPYCLQMIEQAIEPKVCRFVDCDINKCFYYDGKQFKITKLVLEGSCCLVALNYKIVILCKHTLQKLKLILVVWKLEIIFFCNSIWIYL